jgi:hypothetical protein
MIFDAVVELMTDGVQPIFTVSGEGCGVDPAGSEPGDGEVHFGCPRTSRRRWAHSAVGVNGSAD